ncbi:hypothetical protein [Actinoallomurus acaciae]|uniref:Uncharacterized protein n=1 Tax=Actinoallomurus acaciae TaxID=502577 RepID=A0ABV5Y8F5_9ACTN
MGQVFGDEVLATAVLDRLLNHLPSRTPPSTVTSRPPDDKLRPADDSASHLADQLDLLTTIEEFLRGGDEVRQLLAAFCSTGPADNDRLTARTIISQFSCAVAGLRLQ